MKKNDHEVAFRYRFGNLVENFPRRDIRCKVNLFEALTYNFNIIFQENNLAFELNYLYPMLIIDISGFLENKKLNEKKAPRKALLNTLLNY
ncbi:hypothetical protein CN292_21250 [Bacillus cereus]|nr:hypothetical protein CN534_05065 [Bacillus cereus]PEZ62092.1 hypothetical protein CN370_09420 [Bacillus cereus]PFB67160.1 hypothetical protein CN292_21250 [Bacillus cereus]